MSTRQPLSISASEAVLVPIRCFRIYRLGANERLLSLRIRAIDVAAGCSLTFTQSRDAFKAEIWEGPAQERGEFSRSVSIFTKTEPNQTFSYKKKESVLLLYALCFVLVTH